MVATPAVQEVPQSERRLALAAALATVVLWASAFVGIRAAGRVLSPGSLALGRLAVGSVALGILTLVRKQPLPRRADLPGLLVCGLLWFGIYHVVLHQAERLLDARAAAELGHVGQGVVGTLL